MNQSKSKERSLPEKISFVVSLSILSVILSLLLYSWSTIEDTPPVLEVTVDSPIRKVNNQYYVPFSVTNTGGATAESVEVVAELSGLVEETETGSQQIDFLSSKEVQQGAFVFDRNPDSGQLKIRVASYKLP